jgi:hypothetical protein
MHSMHLSTGRGRLRCQPGAGAEPTTGHDRRPVRHVEPYTDLAARVRRGGCWLSKIRIEKRG